MTEIVTNYPFLLFGFAFFGMLFSNTFPIMFFLFPEIIITSSIYLSNEARVSIYLVFIFSFIGAVLGETISFFIGKKIKKEYLYRFFKKEKLDRLRDIFYKHNKKSIVIGKLTPGITWLVPIFFGLIQYDFKKFFLLNTLMIFYSLATFFFSIVVGFSVFNIYFNKYKIYLFIFLILFFVFISIYNFNKIKIDK